MTYKFEQVGKNLYNPRLSLIVPSEGRKQFNRMRYPDGAAVVIGQYEHRHILKEGLKDPLARDVEIITIHQRENGRHGRASKRMNERLFDFPSAETEMIEKRLHASGLDQPLRGAGI